VSTDQSDSKNGRRDGAADGRDETRTERLDRNWDDLLQELRVTQTGVQILTGFLLTLPFQQRFEKLSELQHDLYLVTFGLAATATGLIIAPVGLHRTLFGRHEKDALVRWADRFARAGLTVLACAVATVAVLVFDVVVSLTAGVIAGIGALLMYTVLWMGLPMAVRGQRSDRTTGIG
jgi:hypothetical protein